MVKKVSGRTKIMYRNASYSRSISHGRSISYSRNTSHSILIPKNRNKIGVVFIFEKIQKYHKQLEEEIREIEKKINSLPEGKLVICHDGKGRCKYFQSDGHTKSYIKKKDIELASQLAYKKYLAERLQETKQEKRATEYYLDHHSKEIPKSIQFISESSEYQKLISKFFTPLDQELNNWMQEPYEKSTKYPHQLIHKTPTGECVRSKSEVFIYSYLYMNKIPFRYECALQLGAITVFPDFTIRHPRTGKIFYWENFGMMDKRDYAKNTYAKLDLYQMHGIIPSIDLITTYETKEHPLGVDVIEKLIEHYFL